MRNRSRAARRRGRERRSAGVVATMGSAMAREIGANPVVRDPAVRHYFRSRVNWMFLMIAGILFAVSWPTLPATHVVPVYTYPVVAALVAFPVAVAWSAPLIGWAISVVSAQMIGVLATTTPDWHFSIQVTHIIALLVLTTTTCLRGPLRALPVVWFCTAVVFFQAAPADQRAGWVFGVSVLVIVIALIRLLIRSRAQLAERTEATELAESRKAVLEERTRIARDLHDVVAHRMSVVVVMAQTARYRLDGVDDACAAEFDAIADAARASLDEVRQMLGVLRLDGSAPATANPGLDDVASLIMATRATGAEVNVVDLVDHGMVGDASGLVAYRIVQESLANATRHAPGARIDVLIAPSGAGLPTAGDADSDAVDVVVTNTAARSAPVGLSGDGTGIGGMVERASAVGGTVTAEATPDGGFIVRARIPHRVPAASGPAQLTR